jgi:cell division protein FtsZ
MHEINEAAETITGAVDPDANIIFGATLREDMDDEIAITVIATGFDASYFTSRAIKDSEIIDEDDEPTSSYSVDEPTPAAASPKDDLVDERTMTALDMDLEAKKSEAEKNFQDDEQTQNIWSYEAEEDDKYDKPSFLRRLTKSKDKAGKDKNKKSKDDAKKSDK